MTDVLTELAETLGVAEDEARVAEGRAIAWARVEEARRRPIGRARRGRRAWLLPAIAMLVVLGGGAAIAQTTGLVDRVLGSEAPAIDRIGVLRSDGETMSQQELDDLFGREEVRERIGEQIDGDRGHRIVESNGIRLSATATSAGAICTVISEWSDGTDWPTRGWHTSSVGCGGEFIDGWPVLEASSARGSRGFVFSYGLVADGVARVRFLADGTTYDAVMGPSGYIWRHPPGVRPDTIEIELDDGTIVHRDMTQMSLFAEYAARTGMVERCVGTVEDAAERKRRVESCTSRHMPDGVERFEPALPVIVTEASGTSGPS